jgi:pyruvate dehydrogenase E1 component alpha subunit
MTATAAQPDVLHRPASWSPLRTDGLVQLIQVDGHRTQGSPYADLVADVDADQLRALYRDLVIVRRIDAEATALQRQGELGLWTPLLGQEAAQVGSARAFRPDDFVFTSYREHGVAYCREWTPPRCCASGAVRPTRVGIPSSSV